MTPDDPPPNETIPSQAPRIGLGWDLHRLEAGKDCVLGGVTIPCQVGPVGHSDADVLLHALCDALLGAAGLDDLGTLFPDTDSKWKGAPSTRFLEESLRLLEDKGLRPLSVDAVLHCDRPKIQTHRPAIRKQLSTLLSLPLSRVNLKGKTLEGSRIGPETIEAQVIVLLGPS